MKTAVLIVMVDALLLAVVAGWQWGACYLHNYELSDDMTTLSLQTRARAGVEPIPNESELRSEVTANAKEHGIELAPEQVTVRETMIAATFAQDGTLESPGVLDISLTAEYDAPVKLIGTAFTVHFEPTASHRAPMLLK